MAPPRLDPRVLLAIGLGACRPVSDAARPPPVDTDTDPPVDTDTDTDVGDTDPPDTDPPPPPRPDKKCLSKIPIDDDGLICLFQMLRDPLPETDMMVCLKAPMTDEQRREMYRRHRRDRESRAPDDVRQEVLDRGVLPEDVAELVRRRRERT